MKVFVVQDGWYDSGEIDSVWLDRGAAEARVAELKAAEVGRWSTDPNWEVVAVRANEPDAVIHDETTGGGSE